MKSIAVFFGGISVEHDVSVITGVLTLNSLDKNIFDPVPIYVHGDGVWYTGKDLADIDFYKDIDFKKLQRVTLLAGSSILYIIKGNKLKQLCTLSAGVNCMHGERGEDGSLSGFLNMCKIPLASPDIASSAVSMDKHLAKTFLKGLGVKTLPCVLSDKGIDVAEEKLGFPVIVKPAKLGSSIGIKKASDRKGLFDAINYAKRFGEKIIIEKCLQDFIEINCAVYKRSDGKIMVSECEQPVGRQEILSFDDKYSSGKRVFPADISEDTSNKIKEISKRVYDELNFTGIIRIDYLIKDKNIYLNEINSVPGSLAYYLFCATLKDFSVILTDLIRLAEKNFAVCNTLQKRFTSSVLNITGGKSAKRL